VSPLDWYIGQTEGNVLAEPLCVALAALGAVPAYLARHWLAPRLARLLVRLEHGWRLHYEAARREHHAELERQGAELVDERRPQ
jgi:hypothetical protein